MIQPWLSSLVPSERREEAPRFGGKKEIAVEFLNDVRVKLTSSPAHLMLVNNPLLWRAWWRVSACEFFTCTTEKLPVMRLMSCCTWLELPVFTSFVSFFSCSNLDFFTKLFYILLGCLLLFAHTSTDLSDGRVCLPVEGCMLRHGSRLCLQGLSVNVFPCFFVHMHVRLWELAYPCSPSCVHASVCVWKTAAAVGVLAAGWVKRRGQLSLWNMLVLISVTRPNRVMNQHKAWDSPDWSTAFSTNTCASLRLHLLPL